jgi:hypothetical protein
MWQAHNYFRPGPSDYSSTPIDSDDDGIAREHDLLYESAKTLDDIHRAVSRAIRDFWNEASFYLVSIHNLFLNEH